MAIDTAPSEVATNALTSIPFSTMIGGPLDAAIKAQALAAKTSWEFIQNVGLQKDPVTGATKATTVVFQYQKNGEMVNLIVPLIAIVPIPYIAIDTITIDFTAKIDASASSVTESASESEGHVSGAVDASGGWGPFSVKVHLEGGYSSKSSSKATQESKYSVEYTIAIHVQAGQDSMPAGLATVLNMLNNAITESNPKGKFEVVPLTTEIGYSEPTKKTMITVTSRNGLDLAVTDDITFDFDFTSIAPVTNSALFDIGRLSIDIPYGTKTSTTNNPLKVKPTSKGVVAIAIGVEPTNVGFSPKNIEGATKDPQCKITSANHGFSNGEVVYISGVVGMTQLNGNYYKVSDSATNDFKLKDMSGNYIDSSAYGTWTSGGTVERKPWYNKDFKVKVSQGTNTQEVTVKVRP